MNKPSLFVFGLFVGVIATWLISTSLSIPRPSKETQIPPSQKKQSPAKTSLSTATLYPISRPSAQASEKTYLQLTDKNVKDVKKIYSALSQAELQSFILHLFSKANPLTGMSYSDKAKIESSLEELARQDFQSTCAWLDSTFKQSHRNELYKTIIQSHFKDKPLEAINFAKKHLDPENLSRLSGLLFITSSPVSNQLAEAIVNNQTYGSSSTGSSSTFSDDFNFLQFAQKSIALVKQHEGGRPSSFPSNFYAEWAARHPSEALKFYNDELLNQKQPLPFNDLGKMVIGYLKVAPREDVSPWLTGLLAKDNLNKKERESAIQAISHDNSVSVKQLKDVVHNLQLTPIETMEFYDANTELSGTTSTQARYLSLKLFPSPQSRIDTFEQKFLDEKHSNYLLRRNFDELSTQLRRLGHTENDIDRLTRAKQKTDK